MRTYDKDKERLKKRRWRARHRKAYNEYQKLYKRKIRGSKLALDESAENKKGEK